MGRLNLFFFYTVFLSMLRITSPLACRGPFFFYSNSLPVLLSLILFSQACTAPPKWCKSILTRDQDPYDKQRLLLQAHQTHLKDRQKQKISAPCAFCWNPIENLLMSSPICATLLSLTVYFSLFLGGYGGVSDVYEMGGGGRCIIKGMCLLEVLCGTGIISVPWIEPSFILFFSPPLFFNTWPLFCSGKFFEDLEEENRKCYAGMEITNTTIIIVKPPMVLL